MTEAAAALKKSKSLTALSCDSFHSLSSPLLTATSSGLPKSKKGWVFAVMDSFRKFEVFLLRSQLLLLGSAVLFGRISTLCLCTR